MRWRRRWPRLSRYGTGNAVHYLSSCVALDVLESVSALYPNPRTRVPLPFPRSALNPSPMQPFLGRYSMQLLPPSLPWLRRPSSLMSLILPSSLPHPTSHVSTLYTPTRTLTLACAIMYMLLSCACAGSSPALVSSPDQCFISLCTRSSPVLGAQSVSTGHWSTGRHSYVSQKTHS